jgi:hypothetical protein
MLSRGCHWLGSSSRRPFRPSAKICHGQIRRATHDSNHDRSRVPLVQASFCWPRHCWPGDQRQPDMIWRVPLALFSLLLQPPCLHECTATLALASPVSTACWDPRSVSSKHASMQPSTAPALCPILPATHRPPPHPSPPSPPPRPWAGPSQSAVACERCRIKKTKVSACWLLPGRLSSELHPECRPSATATNQSAAAATPSRQTASTT